METNKKNIEEKYNLVINEYKSNFQTKVKKITEINNNIAKRSGNIAVLISKRKQVKESLKPLSKEIIALSKRKSNEIKKKIKKNNHEKKNRIKTINKKIKTLQKESKVVKAKKFAKKWRSWGSYTI